METQNPERSENQSRNQRTWLIILAILFGLSLIGMIAFMIRSGRVSDEKERVESEKELLQIEKQNLTEDKQTLEVEKEQLQSEINRLETAKEEELREKDLRIARLSRVAAEVSALRDEVAAYKILEEQHEELEEDHRELKAELNNLEREYEQLQERYNTLRDTVQLTRPMMVYNINYLTKWDRWLCADRYNVVRARRVDETRINFEIDGTAFSPIGERDVQMVMIAPDGEIINPSEDPFVIAETGQESPYTKKRTVEYEGEPIHLRFTVLHEERLPAGTYEINVYIDGHLTRTKDLQLE